MNAPPNKIRITLYAVLPKISLMKLMEVKNTSSHSHLLIPAITIRIPNSTIIVRKTSTKSLPPVLAHYENGLIVGLCSAKPMFYRTTIVYISPSISLII